jgi:serine/threonine-protein kinase RsbW
MKGANHGEKTRRILGRVPRDQFVGRTTELQQLVSYPTSSAEARGVLLLLAPSAGVSELLRQAYDELFNRRGEVVPIYFAFERSEDTAVSAAIEFLNTFLLQYVGYRRNEPTLCHASLTLSDLLELAPSADHEWIEQLIVSYNRERFSNDDNAFVQFCLNAPQRVPSQNGRPLVMIDIVQLAAHLHGAVSLGGEITKALARSNLPFILAGLRRQVLDLAHSAGCDFDAVDIVRLEKLAEEDGRRLVEQVALRQHVEINEETRDLLVQQFESSPCFITALLQAARERNLSLTTYLDCEQLYVDDLMGGHLNRHFTSVLEEIVPEPQTRGSLIRLLCDVALWDNRNTTFETWRKRLHVEINELENILHGLHVQELVNWDGAAVEAADGPATWKDYLKIRYRLEVKKDPRALVVASAIADALKRAPHMMARHYRRAASLRLSELLVRFDSQRVPAILFNYDRFIKNYNGAPAEEIIAGLVAETDLVRLPQVFHAASCAAFSREMQPVCEEERCAVAHAFEGAAYSNENEIIWLVAEIESKLEADRELVEMWCNRLEVLARKSSFGRFHVWLISKEGFSSEAVALLHKRHGYGSSRQQVDLLAARLSENPGPPKNTTDANEFVMILPMGDDNELLAANTVEQIARRLNFRPEAINQIKTAIVEACMNVAEHNFSSDQRIYQHFRIESDRLVVSISSRGVVPSKLQSHDIEPVPPLGGIIDDSEERRGWGLELIRTLMDEVEFERVDEGLRLRMIKYLRNSSS